MIATSAVIKVAVSILLPYMVHFAVDKQDKDVPVTKRLFDNSIAIAALTTFGCAWACQSGPIQRDFAYLLILLALTASMAKFASSYKHSVSLLEVMIVLMIAAGSEDKNERILLMPLLTLLVSSLANN